MPPIIKIDKNKIRAFCRVNHIRKLSFFGSVLRSDFGPESDIDVLVEFESGHTPGLQFFAMQEELSQLLGRKVDLNTTHFLNHNLRDQIIAEAETQYEQA